MKFNLSKALKKFAPALFNTTAIDYASLNVVCVGDSLTSGDGASTGNTYPQQLAALKSFANVRNQGIAGLQVTQLSSGAATVDGFLNTYKNNICVVWCGTNDLANNLAAGISSTTYTTLVAYCQARRTAGWKVVVADLIARNVVSNQTLFNTERANYNSLIAANWASFANAFVPLSARAELTNASNTTYFQNDGIHLRDLSYGYVAAEMLLGLQRLSLPPSRIIALSGSLAFGNVQTGHTSDATLTIANNGVNTLAVSNIALPAGFSASWSSGNIAGGGTQNSTITFAPTAEQNYGGTRRVSSNATSGTSTAVTSGAGTTAPQFDTDATTYMNALTSAGATLSGTQQNAIDTLVRALKTASIWNSLVAVYPFVGGTAATHAINAKTPGTYNITWNGTVTHSANGILGNQSNGYGDLGLTPSTVFGSGNNLTSLGIYSRTQDHAGTIQVDLGCLNSYSQALALAEEIDNASGKLYFTYDNGFFTSDGGIRNTQGFLVGTKPNSGHTYLYKNGTLLTDYTTAEQTSPPTVPMYILAWNAQDSTHAPQYYTKRQLAFAFVGNALPTSSMSAFYSAVQAFQTSLNRQV